ncbi:double-strand break repair helicase AddA [Profundibacter sp.]
MTRRDEATERQVQAAAPTSSTWLSANAGSGKTRVLTDRVARLLLEGVSPQHILCLTYTKAAASEMQNRLFKRLGTWAMQDSETLAKELRELGVERRIDADELSNARTLFARAIETPGGLKIQTIHSFCASILRRFPLEAGVSPQFTEMDDRAAKLLRAEIVEEMADGPDVGAIDALAAHYSDSDFERLTGEVTKRAAQFAVKKDKAGIWQMFGLKTGVTEQDILSGVILGSEADLFAALMPALLAGSANDIKAHAKLAALDPANIGFADLEILESVFLTGSGAKEPFSAKIDSFPTKATRLALGTHLVDLNNLMARVETAREARISLYSAEKTLALHQFATEFLPRYAQQKQLRGWLDFDDLINLTAKLLHDPQVASWVLYRLDGGIDHILVDEAQDTSPQQWDVIERLAQEFTSGEGAMPDRVRTIFVVGDRKQSIYSFQGADPEEFERMKLEFQARLEAANLPFQSLQLEYSFRSAEPIMRLVDCTLQDHADQGLGDSIKHLAFKTGMPGRVDLWPIIPKTEAPEQKEWHDPTDKIAKNHETILLANKIADRIAEMCSGAVIPQEVDNTGTYKMRPVTEGDFLILVQRRSALFHEIIRACKSRDLAIAGADRLKIGGELAVKDLTALLAFLATPEDNLSLAAALRSPLFGWSEQDLFNLAHKRPAKTFLWSALRNIRDTYPDTLAMLDALRKDADFLRPYELLERILTRFHGRKNLLARLGDEAEDGIDALLNQAMNYERMDVPSLTGFITWLQAEEVEIKRQMDGESDRIRVMTVHGAKGLEAPIVILPDTVGRGSPPRDELYLTDSDDVMWKVKADASPKVMNAARERLKLSQEQERLRLLYVAMTRAEKWLIVCGAGDPGKEGKSWHAMIEAGMKTAGAVPYGDWLRLEYGDWGGEVKANKPDDKPDVTLPDWAKTDAKIPDRPVQTLSPSQLGGAKVLTGDGDGLSEDTAKQRGSDIHLLLEHLPAYPQAEWPGVAAMLLPDAAPDILAEVTALLSNPDLAFVFDDSTLAEVPITASLPDLGGKRIHGEIDRLIISPERILAVDFKSNAIVPENPAAVPDGLLRQMGAYQAALGMVYPDHKIEIAILWTRTGTLMYLEQMAVTAALRATTIP